MLSPMKDFGLTQKLIKFKLAGKVHQERKFLAPRHHIQPVVYKEPTCENISVTFDQFYV